MADLVWRSRVRRLERGNPYVELRILLFSFKATVFTRPTCGCHRNTKGTSRRGRSRTATRSLPLTSLAPHPFLPAPLDARRLRAAWARRAPAWAAARWRTGRWKLVLGPRGGVPRECPCSIPGSVSVPRTDHTRDFVLPIVGWSGAGRHRPEIQA